MVPSARLRVDVLRVLIAPSVRKVFAMAHRIEHAGLRQRPTAAVALVRHETFALGSDMVGSSMVMEA